MNKRYRTKNISPFALFVLSVIFLAWLAHENYEHERHPALAAVYADGFLTELDDKGHAIENHVGKNDAYLRSRLEREDIYAASTFETMAEAEKSIRYVLQEKQDLIHKWLNVEKSDRKVLYAHMGYPIGRIMFRNKNTAIKGNYVRVILFRDASYPHGYGILTAYPERR